ncbi:hypothetical protein CWE13_11190 [Aliidiomarina shirensis]|uniref:Uncharacterized protein n=1 Tax=Aliidiomarina shirensis TaxID=1048642 RepID=A0A432WP61_9GAMM|nr:hypothetical protein [Aliidiomarina shirensis]RUO35487.1 hypothetical protein CWE13_11190 [Aliidiomarina shirensis]
MFELIKMMLFAKVIMLTPNPIDIEPGCLELELAEPLSAINEGAVLYIDVSSMLPDDVNGIFEARAWVKETFPKRSVQARLHDSYSDTEVELFFEGDSSWSENQIRLVLSGTSGVPTSIEYDKLFVETNIDLKGVSIIWKNYSK